jgi:hypothetical protein
MQEIKIDLYEDDILKAFGLENKEFLEFFVNKIIRKTDTEKETLKEDSKLVQNNVLMQKIIEASDLPTIIKDSADPEEVKKLILTFMLAGALLDSKSLFIEKEQSDMENAADSLSNLL